MLQIRQNDTETHILAPSVEIVFRAYILLRIVTRIMIIDQ